jgi:hypothetical protein
VTLGELFSIAMRLKTILVMKSFLEEMTLDQLFSMEVVLDSFSYEITFS